MERENTNPTTRMLPSTAPSTNLIHMTPVNVRPRRIMTLDKQIKVIKR